MWKRKTIWRKGFHFASTCGDRIGRQEKEERNQRGGGTRSDGDHNYGVPASSGAYLLMNKEDLEQMKKRGDNAKTGRRSKSWMITKATDRK